MKLHIFAIRDSKAEIFSHPIFAVSAGSAIRSFADSVNGGVEAYSKHPADYTLFCIGEYDDGTGMIVPHKHGPQNLGNGATFVTSAGGEK